MSDARPQEADAGPDNARNARPGARRWQQFAPYFAAAALIVCIAAWNFRFIALDQTDYGVRDADSYMDLALSYEASFHDGIQLADFRRAPRTPGEYLYLPVNWIVGGLWAHFTSPTPESLRFYAAIFLPFALIYVYRFSRLFVGPWASLIAVFVGGTGTLALESSRYFLQDAPLSLAAAGLLYHAARSDGFTRWRQTACAAFWLVFGAAMKIQFTAMALLPIMAIALSGWILLWKMSRRRLLITLMAEFGMVAVFLGALYWLKPNVFEMVRRADEAIRTGVFSLRILDDPGASPALRFFANIFLCLLYMLRRVAWPMALLFVAGTIVGIWKLRGRRQSTNVAAVALLFLSTNFLFVWTGTQLELERYYAPLFVLFGVPVVVLAGLPANKTARRLGVAALGIYALVGVAGPELRPFAFDTELKAAFPGLRFQWEEARKNFPLVAYKLWDEPRQRPIANPTEAKVEASLRTALADHPAAANPARVFTLASNFPGNDSFYHFERMRIEGVEFIEAREIAELLTADFALIVLPAAPGSTGYNPTSARLALPEAQYHAVVIALDSPDLRYRLGFEQFDDLGLMQGRQLRLYRRSVPAGESALNGALAILETVYRTPGDMKEMKPKADALGVTLAAQLEKEGFAQAAGDMRALFAPAVTGEPPAPPPGVPAHRMSQWLAMNADASASTTLQSLQALVQEALARPAAGPGFNLALAINCLRYRQTDLAATLVKANLAKYPAHAETWGRLQYLALTGLTVPAQLADAGTPLTQDYFNELRITDQPLRVAKALAGAGWPQHWEMLRAKAEALNRDQPRELRTILYNATLLDLEGGSVEKRIALLEEAIGMAGGPYTERADYLMRVRLGDAYMAAGRADDAIASWKMGGWEGVNHWIEWLKKEGDEKGLKAARKWASKKRFALELTGGQEFQQPAK